MRKPVEYFENHLLEIISEFSECRHIYITDGRTVERKILSGNTQTSEFQLSPIIDSET
jgi:hypothetical protein